MVLLDNGRTRALADEVGRQALRCIRCSACLNSCPVYERVGGHAYGSVYPGPIGAILNPLLKGVGTDPQVDSLPYASTLCGACADVCPVAHRHPRHPGAPAHPGRRRPPRRHRAQGRGGGHAGRGLGDGGCRPHGSGRARRRPRGPVSAAAAGCRVVAARCPGCPGPGRAGPRPATSRCRPPSRSVPGGAGSAATRSSDERPRRRARRRPRRPGAEPRPRRRRRGHGSNGGDGTASADPSASATAASRVDRAAMLDLFAERVADYRATVTRCAAADLARRDRRLRSTARHPSSSRPGWISTSRARSSTTG